MTKEITTSKYIENIQQWIDFYYPIRGRSIYSSNFNFNEKRKNILKLYFSDVDLSLLKGNLDLKSFNNLEEIYCKREQLPYFLNAYFLNSLSDKVGKIVIYRLNNKNVSSDDLFNIRESVRKDIGCYYGSKTISYQLENKETVIVEEIFFNLKVWRIKHKSGCLKSKELDLYHKYRDIYSNYINMICSMSTNILTDYERKFNDLRSFFKERMEASLINLNNVEEKIKFKDKEINDLIKTKDKEINDLKNKKDNKYNARLIKLNENLRNENRDLKNKVEKMSNEIKEFEKCKEKLKKEVNDLRKEKVKLRDKIVKRESEEEMARIEKIIQNEESTVDNNDYSHYDELIINTNYSDSSSTYSYFDEKKGFNASKSTTPSVLSTSSSQLDRKKWSSEIGRDILEMLDNIGSKSCNQEAKDNQYTEQHLQYWPGSRPIKL